MKVLVLVDLQVERLQPEDCMNSLIGPRSAEVDLVFGSMVVLLHEDFGIVAAFAVEDLWLLEFAAFCFAKWAMSRSVRSFSSLTFLSRAGISNVSKMASKFCSTVNFRKTEGSWAK